ncbi:hypothetical protein GSI_07752 [Ganoderma sinense ZZ0214-1]|uniref:Uncharacterized protein n=1 Tax=Ganoderma sinense ZZ0214-1 TaxID=1077348 RepID=A0A2G8S8K1_9APHY|nr:hypothetical protein GSI_07683 [Ganoderma sinense ZZ0214-1]PIL30174.1 hypothetical protein GSI_07752 [Ganoderma sinense ZZ0214-1]
MFHSLMVDTSISRRNPRNPPVSLYTTSPKVNMGYTSFHALFVDHTALVFPPHSLDHDQRVPDGGNGGGEVLHERKHVGKDE